MERAVLHAEARVSGRGHRDSRRREGCDGSDFTVANCHTWRMMAQVGLRQDRGE